MKVTPWEVSGEIDYERLIKEFGTSPLTPELKEEITKIAGDHVMLRRGYFYSHRDLDVALRHYKEGKGFFLYTGRGPSGPMHLGHLIPMIFTKWLQEKFRANVYIEVTDDEKFLYKKDAEWGEIQKYTIDNILDIAAVGFDPERTFIFRDSEYIANAYPLILKIARKITFSTAKAVFGFTNETNIGMIFYPAYQVLPTMFEKKICLIPAAIDQDPYWRIQRDIAESLGYYKTAAIHSKFFPPLQGIKGKMSSSQKESAIWLSDDEKTVRSKIMKYAFSGGQPTIEEHRKKGGNPDVDVSFQWLKIFFEPDDGRLKKIEEEYRSGKMLTGELKEILVEKVCRFLEEHRGRRDKAREEIKEFMYEGKLASEMWGKRFE
jgi:tryptophanyl-tRNA synthetase